MVISGANPATLSERVYGMPAKEGLSPFAIRRGERFEAALFEDDNKRIFELYQRNGRLGEKESVWSDLSHLFTEFNQESLMKRQQQSEEWIRDRLLGKKKTPNLIIKPRLSVQIMGVSHPTEPDALVAADGDKHYRPVEIKSYADRRAFTDATKTGSACRQAAVALIALEQLLGEEASEDRIVDLIFAKPATNWPTLHPMSVGAEVENLKSVFEHAPQTLEQVEKLLQGESLDSVESMNKLPNRLCSDCADHCPLWDSCRIQAIQQSDISLWGDQATEILSGVSDMNQALQLQKTGHHSEDRDLDLLAAVLHEARKAHDRICEDEE